MSMLRRPSMLGAIVSAWLLAYASGARADFFYQTTSGGTFGNGVAGFVTIAGSNGTESGSSATVTLENVTFSPGTSPSTITGTLAFQAQIDPYPANTPVTTYNLSGTFTATYSGGAYSATYSPTETLSGPTDLYDLTNVHYVALTGTTGEIVGTIGAFSGGVNPVPEPASMALVGIGMLAAIGFGLMRRRRASA